ncbi:serine hydrolase [Mesorhizobium sp. LHD-90]|uniref:serine hydrolase domain-containing protein n=1 Tax=Mesorhizobium sp. LHD-90 TaxID=3071414 RepID=UPI0027DEF3CF|nr:serine hydrolase [Mesorhizobium sp. LHD-90]MDQ6433446.1 serine hydrolase [Mesorhizobium sp. LHD-90]
MRRTRRLAKGLAILLVIVVGTLIGWLHVAPPELIRVGAGYSAKIVCSNVFLAGRDAAQVLADDVQAPGHPLLQIMRVSVDRDHKTVSAGLLGFFGARRAVARDGLGCTVLPEGFAADRLEQAPTEPIVRAADASGLWPQGNTVEAAPDAEIDAILDDPAMTGPGMRAVVVVKDGRIVVERYGDGFSADTPLLGWSMTKTVTAAIIGTLVKDGKMTVDDRRLFGDWQADGRAEISVVDLMGMSSGLEFNEDYGDVTDVTRMLFLEPDMAGFAAAKPLAHPVGSDFSYSSGTTLLLSRVWQHALGGGDTALAWPRAKLFGPLGMDSAVLETDAAGTFVGSSYLYATARDWARFGQFLLQDGVWKGEAILPEGFVAWMRQPAPASSGAYGRGQLWLRGPDGTRAEDAALGIPDDAFWINGHDGQTVTVIPSRKLVVVRMGLTPDKLGYRPQKMVAAVVKALQ